ncbi:hypothetical protein GCM10022293_27240 [Azospirillum formosense]
MQAQHPQVRRQGAQPRQQIRKFGKLERPRAMSQQPFRHQTKEVRGVRAAGKDRPVIAVQRHQGAVRLYPIGGACG